MGGFSFDGRRGRTEHIRAQGFAAHGARSGQLDAPAQARAGQLVAIM